MKVILLAHTPDPEKTIACAAKLCYSSSGIDSLYDSLTEDVQYEKRAAFLQKLLAKSTIPVHTVLDLACGTGTMRSSSTPTAAPI